MSWRSSPLPGNWGTIRAAVLQQQPTCQLAWVGCTTRSTEVDHIGRPDDHSRANLRGVCHRCHTKRTAMQAAAAKPRARRKPERHPGLT